MRSSAGSTALRKPADVTFSTSLDKRQLGATVGAGADEVLLRSARRTQGCVPRTPPYDLRGSRGRRPRAVQQVLLDPLLVLHPFLDRDPDRIGYRHHLVRAESHRPVGLDAAQLP